MRGGVECDIEAGGEGAELEVSNAHVRHIKTTSRGDNAAGDGPGALIGVLTEMRR